MTSVSNEAGIGSAAIAHSAVRTHKPITEGFVALLEPFIDTVVICTITGLVIVAVADDPDDRADGHLQPTEHGVGEDDDVIRPLDDLTDEAVAPVSRISSDAAVAAGTMINAAVTKTTSIGRIFRPRM